MVKSLDWNEFEVKLVPKSSDDICFEKYFHKIGVDEPRNLISLTASTRNDAGKQVLTILPAEVFVIDE